MSWHEKYKLLIFDDIDSTNSEGLRMAKTRPSENYLLLAKNQIQSRGRTTKTWYSSLGNLHATILLRHHIDLQYISQLSFVVAVAVHSTISSLASEKNNSIILKWPNDVLINNKKVSGILIESVKDYLVIGVGINIVVSPLANIDQEITNLADEAITPLSPEELLEILIINFEKYFNIWKNQGFSKIKQQWLKRSYKLGEEITINDGNSRITGIFNGLELDGAIKLLLPSGEMYIGRG